MKTFHPKVSIVIPVYNGSNYLAEAIDSALAQTYDNIEIIVVNDGSTDNGATEKIAKSYGDKIRYFSKENGGVATALNFGIEKMTGEYFSWLSHDDMYEKMKIEEQVNKLKSLDRKDVIIACNAKYLFPNGVKQNEYIDKNAFEFTDIFLATSAVVGINGCALLIPKIALIESGGFDSNLPVTQDYDLWFRLQKKYKFILIEKNLSIYRRHDGQDSVKKQKLCFDAGEDLHYNFLNSIDYERFEQFFNTSQKNVTNYWENYITYKSSGFKKTAYMMLKYLLRYYSENDKEKFSEIFSSEIGKIIKSDIVGSKKTKKRILFYNNVWHKGGIERVLSILFKSLEKRYDCVLVIDESSDDGVGYELPDSVSYFKVNGKNQIIELMNLVSLLDADLFIGNPNISEKFLDIYSLLKDTTTKSIAYNHGYYFLPYMCGEYLYPVALKIKEAYKYADYVIWLTKIACNVYNLENSNGVYIPNPAIIDANNIPKKIANKKVLAVGRFDDEIKQIDKTLLVFKELYKIDPKYCLEIVGYCPMDMQLPRWENITLDDFIKKQNIPIDSITFLGEQQNILKHYESASFLILTSRCEGFGMVLLEALASGVPCAVFEYIGIEEIIQNSQNGWVRPQDDYVGLANDIVNTISNKKKFIDMSRNSVTSVKQFEVNNFYEKWENLIELALGEKSSLKQVSLKPENDLTNIDYKRIVLEYEKLLKVLTNDYLAKVTEMGLATPRPVSKVKKISIRFKDSIRRDGLYLTGEKIARKAHKKILKR